MSIALQEFWTRLVRSGLCDAEGCRKVASAYAEVNSGTPPSQAEAVARFMVKRGKLTRFQAKSLLATPPREIRSGNYVIRSDKTPPPYSRWLQAARLSDGQVGMLLALRIADSDSQLLNIMKGHQAVAWDSLQPIEFEFHADSTLAFIWLPTGRCMHQALVDHRPLPHRDVFRFGISLADALAKLHAAALVHGAVRADRVWLGEDGHVILLRDPLAADSCESSKQAFLDDLEHEASYAAPELHSAGQGPTVASDIYGLGCLLFRLATGELPFQGASEAEIHTAHQLQTPPQLAEAVRRGETGDPLFRVLAFALAKLPSSRFRSADQLAGALRAASTMSVADDTSAKTLHQQPTAAPPAPPPTPVASAAPPTSSDTSTSETEPKQSPRREPPPNVTVSKKPRVASSSRDMIPSREEEASEPRMAPKLRRLKTPAPRTPAPRTPAPETPAPETPAPRTPAPETPDSETLAPKADSPSRDRGEESTTPSKVNRKTKDSSSEIGVEGESAPVSSKEPTAIPVPSTSQAPPASYVASEGGAVEAPPAASTEPAADRTPRRRRRKKSKSPLVLGALCVAVLLLMIGLIVGDPTGGETEPRNRTRPPLPDVIPPVTNRVVDATKSSKAEQSNESAGGYALTEDDRLLFAPPYPANPSPAPLELLPPGPAAIVTLRLADIIHDATASELINYLSPDVRDMVEGAADRAKVSVDSVQRLTIALHPGREGWPEFSLVVELGTPVSIDDLTSRLGVSAAQSSDGATIYVSDQDDADAYYWVKPDDGMISRYAIGSVERMIDVAAVGGGKIPLPTSVQSLWDSASDESDLIVLFQPNFLFADGRALLEQSVPSMMGPLKQLMQPDVASAVVSVSICDEDLAYVEARLTPSGGISHAALMQKLADHVNGWPQWADEFILTTVTNSSWRLLASRLPSMMRFVVAQIRFGISEGQVVANAYLPSQALPQVTLATVLAMNTPLSEVASSEIPAAKPPLSVEEMLDRPMDVSFDQESLEFALDAIINAFKQSLPAGSKMPPTRIVGGDLQLMGITQNQQVRDFSKSNLPLRTVLTDLVVGANPDKSATGPSDPKQSLIWVVAEDSSASGGKVILITTRQAAETKGYPLPKEFQAEPPSDQ